MMYDPHDASGQSREDYYDLVQWWAHPLPGEWVRKGYHFDLETAQHMMRIKAEDTTRQYRIVRVHAHTRIVDTTETTDPNYPTCRECNRKLGHKLDCTRRWAKDEAGTG
jgi:hypothetical protein